MSVWVDRHALRMTGRKGIIMRITLDFALDDCIIVKSLDDDDMSLTYNTPVGDFVLTISRGDAVVEWNGIISAPDNIIPQAEKLLKTMGWYW